MTAQNSLIHAKSYIGLAISLIITIVCYDKLEKTITPTTTYNGMHISSILNCSRNYMVESHLMIERDDAAVLTYKINFENKVAACKVIFIEDLLLHQFETISLHKNDQTLVLFDGTAPKGLNSYPIGKYNSAEFDAKNLDWFIKDESSIKKSKIFISNDFLPIDFQLDEIDYIHVSQKILEPMSLRNYSRGSVLISLFLANSLDISSSKSGHMNFIAHAVDRDVNINIYVPDNYEVTSTVPSNVDVQPAAGKIIISTNSKNIMVNLENIQRGSEKESRIFYLSAIFGSCLATISNMLPSILTMAFQYVLRRKRDQSDQGV